MRNIFSPEQAVREVSKRLGCPPAVLATKGEDLTGKTAVISGSGNVATHAAEKIVQLGGKVLTLSDSGGYIHDPDGIDQEKIDWVKTHKTHRRGRIEEYVEAFPKATFVAGKTPWGVPCDVALPCATQNELLGDDARMLIANGCKAVAEGANMPTDLDGVHVFKAAKILYAPGKASNAGGVAVSAGRSAHAWPSWWRCRLRPRNEPELRAPFLEGRGTPADAQGHHGRHPQVLPCLWRPGRRVH